MNEIKCPKCGTMFQISETDYESIVKQIRNKEFEKEVMHLSNQHKIDKENAIKLAEANIEKMLKEQINKKELEIKDLKNEIKNKEEQTQNILQKKYNEELHNKTLEINDLKNKIKIMDTEKTLAINEAVIKKDKEIDTLTNKLELSKNEYLIKEKSLKENYEEKIKNKDEQILYYKDFKAKQSTKMIGESLEQHCSNEFNKLRPLFKNCYFEKDNDI